MQTAEMKKENFSPLKNGVRTLAEIERMYIIRAIKTLGGSRKNIAEALGICVRSLSDKVKKYRAQGYEIRFDNPMGRPKNYGR